jgi:argonaute-like protein implicated in RNA metabolism and viral defense
LLEVVLENGTDHCTVHIENPVRNSTDRKVKVIRPSGKYAEKLIAMFALSANGRLMKCINCTLQ